MLGKLMKHEWRSVYKVGCIMLLTILAVTFVGCIFLNSPTVEQLFAQETNGDEFDIQVFSAVMTIIVSFGMYMLLLIGTMYGIMIYLGVHFYKTMYTDQGYLVHTLPVTPHQILTSKLVISGIWTLLVNLALIVSMLALLVSFILSVAHVGQQDMSLADIWNNLGYALEYAFASDPEMKEFAIVYVVVLGISLFISPFFSMLMMFGGLTIGQLSKKYKVMMSILSLIGLVIVYTIISTVVSFVAAFSSTMQTVGETVMPTDAMSVTYGVSLGIMVLMGVILYFVSHYIVSKKLNMD